MNWRTPLRALKPDEMWEVFRNEQTGVYEWICGPLRANELLNGGMRSINGQPCIVQKIDDWPALKGVHVRALCDLAQPVARAA